MKIFISGLLNVETTVKVDEFPIAYSPIDYPFFGVNSAVSGVAYNIAKAQLALKNDVNLLSMVGNDIFGRCILNEVQLSGIDTKNIYQTLMETPNSVVLYDKTGRRKIYCDLKDIQDKKMECDNIEEMINECDIVVACNANMNREILRSVKGFSKTIATDVHVLSDVNDEYNKDFMEYADILFLSDEGAGDNWRDLIIQIKNKFNNNIIVMGRGSKGVAMYIREEDEIYELPAYENNNIVNTVGAGDALFSGFVSYYGNGVTALEAIKYAQIFASYKIGFDGAANGFASLDKMDELIKKHAYSMLSDCRQSGTKMQILVLFFSEFL